MDQEKYGLISKSSRIFRGQCSFYMRTGSCRHGYKCSRVHTSPTTSQTILLKNLCRFVDFASLSKQSSRDVEEQFEELYREIYDDLSLRYGEILELHILENLAEHLIGNVYIKFRRKSDARKAVLKLNDRWFNGRPIYAELCPINDFRDAYCRQYENKECTRGGFCNFMHVFQVSQKFLGSLKVNYLHKSLEETTRTPSRSCSESSIASTSDSSSDEVSSDFPRRYNIEQNRSSESPEEFESNDEESFTPKAFDMQRYQSEGEEEFEMSDEEQEILRRRKQIMRRSRWHLNGIKILNSRDLEWNEKAEQNFIFSLL